MSSKTVYVLFAEKGPVTPGMQNVEFLGVFDKMATAWLWLEFEQKVKNMNKFTSNQSREVKTMEDLDMAWGDTNNSRKRFWVKKETVIREVFDLEQILPVVEAWGEENGQ